MINDNIIIYASALDRTTHVLYYYYVRNSTCARVWCAQLHARDLIYCRFGLSFFFLFFFFFNHPSCVLFYCFFRPVNFFGYANATRAYHLLEEFFLEPKITNPFYFTTTSTKRRLKPWGRAVGVSVFFSGYY